MKVRDTKVLKNLLKTTNVQDANYSLYSVINYAAVLCFLAHLSFLTVFLLLGYNLLAFINIFSSSIYVVIFFINRRGLHNVSLVLGTIEVMAHAVLLTIYLGWNTGFHYYILCLVPLLFFSQTLRGWVKSISNTVLCMTYIVMHYYTMDNLSIYNIASTTAKAFNVLNIIMAFIAFSILAHYYSWAVNKATVALNTANKKLEILSETDPLTGLANRRGMLKFIENNINIFNSTGKTFVLIIADIDNFKVFNDRHGHNCGDLVLSTSAAIIRSQLIERGVASRWGGEEFLILLPESNLEEGIEAAEKLRRSVQDTSIIYKDRSVSITMTFGVTVFNESVSVETAVGNADTALYEGKNKGRNCVIA